ncbi:hypothetical protein LEP1GSC060_2715 [Leptospira weilii serovar Ranarum str. ICFT]|uniref:Uncharacterized protein n=1 Tax=Leptospira weilii serovar Ranarum str. ICFT TaxID=1218598 RepID=N1WQ38_9LEPT|nr:hypothetical protein LEP1GSC060_2715 [Leptospira weilii serovar Ranarum str. ICFT]
MEKTILTKNFSCHLKSDWISSCPERSEKRRFTNLNFTPCLKPEFPTANEFEKVKYLRYFLWMSFIK